MTTRYDLCTDRKDQNDKTHWTKIGVMFPAKNGDGFAIKLEALPLPNDKGEVWVSAFVPKDKDDSAPPARQQAPTRGGRDPLDGDIPF
jgi:hypothetical protein